MVRCGACGATSGAGKRFCIDCGAALHAACPVCGEPVEQGQRFCGECGAPLIETASGGLGSRAAGTRLDTGRDARSAPLAVTDGPGPELRHVSVLFCDLVGFTPLAERRDPEEVRELLSGYFELARAIVTRYGGVVEKFIGDAVMALWGAPVAKEDDAERAVRAGLELVSAVPAYGASRGAELSARVGVATGSAAMTETAEEGLVVGDRVNTAARIQTVAPPGCCYVDATSMRLSASAIGFDDAGEHLLKGKASPEQLWRAVRVLSGVGGKQRVDGLEAPLIGRDTELRTVKDLFHASIERRLPRLVVVSGPAGVGKSRLGWEFEKYADGLVDTVLWHRGRCLSYGEGVAFWALAEIVRQRLGIAEEDSTAVAGGKLAEGLVRFVADGEREYVAARLARLLGVELPGDGGASLAREELFAGWRLFFERLAQIAPVVLLVEDAQHADVGLLDFLDHLVDWTRDLPVFVLVFARPEVDEVKAGFGTGRNRSTLSLDPLDPASMDGLVEALVPGMPASARSAITARAQGNPMFAVETVRSLIDREIVIPRDGVYRLVGEVGELSVPDSLQALLAARLDALDPPARALVTDASVVGSSFPAEALLAVSGREESEVRAGLSELVRRGVLEVSADPLSPQRGNYRFGQEMLRQVAYDTLSRRDRKARHLAVAGHLRAVFANDGEEIAEVIAHHYLDALAAGPDDPDADAIRAEALTALVRAGERAERAGAPGGAAASYATAADLAAASASASEDGVREVRAAALRERAALADVTAADWDSAVEHAEAARQTYLDRADTRGAARAQTVAGRALRRSGRHSDARRQLTEALAVLGPEPDTDTVGALEDLAALEIFDGGPERERLSAEALALGQALDVDDALLATLFTTRGIAHVFANRTAEAAAYYREAARLAERVGNAAALSRALLNLSDLLGRTEPAGAAETARAAADHARRIGERLVLGIAIGNLAEALLALGEWDEAASVLAAAVEQDGLGDVEAIRLCGGLLAGLRGDAELASTALALRSDLPANEDVQVQALVAVLEAFTAAALDRPVDTLAHVRVVLGLAGAIGVGHESVRWAWPLAARTARALGDTAASVELDALLDSHPVGHLPPLLRAERDLARACAAAEINSSEADRAFRDAVLALRQVASPYHLAHGLLDHAARLTQSSDHAGARAAIDEARAIAARLRCPPLIRRADSVTNELAAIA
jgi:class 3 adenylate cyclase/predicted ATPase